MPLAKHFSVPALNLGYLYTNYKRNEVVASYDKNGIGENRPTIYESVRKPEIVPLTLETVTSVRNDYNDLGDSFQRVFGEVANEYFDIQDSFDIRERIAKIEAKGLNLKPEITSDIITGVEIDDYDNFVAELKEEGSRTMLTWNIYPFGIPMHPYKLRFQTSFQRNWQSQPRGEPP